MVNPTSEPFGVRYDFSMKSNPANMQELVIIYVSDQRTLEIRVASTYSTTIIYDFDFAAGEIRTAQFMEQYGGVVRGSLEMDKYINGLYPGGTLVPIERYDDGSLRSAEYTRVRP